MPLLSILDQEGGWQSFRCQDKSISAEHCSLGLQSEGRIKSQRLCDADCSSEQETVHYVRIRLKRFLTMNIYSGCKA